MQQQQKLFDTLQNLSINFIEHKHVPLKTIEQAQQVADSLSVPQNWWCKNLFLKDKKKRLWLFVVDADTRVPLKDAAKVLQAPNLRFADVNLLMKYLNVEPGSVTPLALINDTQNNVNVVIDKRLLDNEYIGCHPLVNDTTLGIIPNDLKKFINSCGHKITLFDFEQNIIVL